MNPRPFFSLRPIGYVVAAGATAAAGCRALDPALGPSLFLVPFVVPVLLAAWCGRGGAGACATALGAAAVAALFNDPVYRSADLARVDFSEYARQLADDLYRTYKVSGDDVRLELAVTAPPLPIDVAIPCGLLLNEQMSNRFKHAFRDGAAGRIRVSLHRDGGANVLTVADDGTGLPAGTDFRNTASFGLQLVGTPVDQLGGAALSAARGTTFTIRFPTPEV